MSGALAALLVALPFACAAALAAIGSWRAGTLLNAIGASVQFAAACALAWSVPSPPVYLAVLLSLVATVAGWFGLRDIPNLITARTFNRRRARVYHVGCQILLGSEYLALLADRPPLTWLGLTLAVAGATVAVRAASTEAAAAAASRLLRQGALGLVLALLGTLLLDDTPELAKVLMLAGYAGMAGLLPVRSWLIGVADPGIAPGAVIAAVLLPAAPLLLVLQLRIDPGWLSAFGLLCLLPCAVLAQASLDWRRAAAVAGMAQWGIAIIALGSGLDSLAWQYVGGMAVLRSVLVHSEGGEDLAWLGLGLLPLVMFALIAAVAATRPWISVLLGVGALLTAWGALERRLPGPRPATAWRIALKFELLLAVLLIAGMPGAVFAWVRRVAG